MRNQTSAAAENVFDALGDPMRRRIVETLRDGPLPVGGIASHLPVGRPAVSKHLRVLEDAGIVEHSSVGTRNLYALVPGGLAPLQQWLVAVRDERVEAFADYVRSAVPADTPSAPNAGS